MNHFYVRVETHPANKAIVRLSTSYELAAPENAPGYASMFFNTFVISPEDYEENFRTALDDLLAIVEKATQGYCQMFFNTFVISPEDYEANFRTALGDLLAIVEKATQGYCQWVPGKFVGAMHLVPLYKRPMP